MPSIIGGPININSQDGVLNFGDTFYIAPKDISKVAAGAGAFNTGNVITNFNGASATNTFDPDAIDQPTSGNA
jgi:spore germination protein PF